MKKLAAFLIATTAVSAPASAVITLTFEGIAPTYPSGNNTNILDFYNGGTSSAGTSGINYGISFGGNALAICLNSLTVSCSNTSRGGIGNPNSQRGARFFLSGDQTFLNYAAGFTTGFSFNYVGGFAGSVGVYDGLNGTGNLLASVSVTPNLVGCPAYSAGFCPFQASGVTFTGTARSISFGGVAHQIVFDDLTFGSAIPGIPEPATWAMLISGFGLAGFAARRRSTGVAFA